MPPIKIIALVFVVFALLKLVVILINPLSWKPVIKACYSRPQYTQLIALIVGIIILHFLLKELTIVQIFASMTFMMALMMVQFAAYGKELINFTDKFFEDRNVLKKAWFSIMIWILLMIWVVVELFV